MTTAEWKRLWGSLSPSEKKRVQAKASWEHESLMYVIYEWFPEFIGTTKEK
jgi:hypothetical protein